MARTTKKTLNLMFDKVATPAPASSVLVMRETAKPRKNGSRNSPIRAIHCSGCNVRIPSALLQRALAGKPIQCEHCHRELFSVADSPNS